MANNYCELSAFLEIPEGKLAQAEEIAQHTSESIEEEEGCLGVVWESEGNGIWFHHDESACPDNVAIIAREIIEELEIDKPFYCSWAYTCSKPRIDEFGGGAFVIQRGKETYWVDAMSHVQDFVER